MTRDEIVRFFERRQKLYLELRASALAADYAADASVSSPFGGVQVGPKAAQKTFEAFFNALNLQTIIFDPPIVDGDRVAQIMHVEGTHAGAEFMGLPATGKHFRFTIAILYALHDGKITNEQRIYDFTGLLVQLGVLRAKPS